MDFITVFKKHWKLAQGEHHFIVLYTVLHSVSVIAQTAQPLAFAMVINTLQAQKEGWFLQVTHWLIAYVLCFYIFEICHRLARRFEVSVAYRNKKRFVLKIYETLQAMPLSWHTKHHSGNIVSRVNRGSDALVSFGQSIYEYITAFVKFVTAVMVLWIISPIISIVGVLTGCLLVLITRKCYDKTVPEYRKLNEGYHEIAGTMQDGIGNITTIIILRLGQCVYHDIEKKFDTNYCHILAENHYTQIKCHCNSLLEIALNVGMIFFYLYSCSKNGILIMLGSITAIFQYVSQIMEAFWFYSTDYESCIHWKADLDAVDDIFDEQPSQYVTKLEICNEWKKIAIRELNFSYDKEKMALTNISLDLQRGKRIALVGESGSGKSTLLKMIRGIYPVESAYVEVDGRPMKTGIASLSNVTTLIPQEAELFDHSVEYNILMGLEHTKEELQQVLYLSEFDEVVEKLPKGLASQVAEDGVNLSGGEKQRLALARGIFSIKDSSIILLDEPTASLDAKTELKVYERIFEQFPDRCIVSVLHRLHLLHLFDIIYVFQDGKIVEQGSFEQLRENQGYFSELWNRYIQQSEE